MFFLPVLKIFMNREGNKQQDQHEAGGQRALEKNETLKDAGAMVPGYGRSTTGVEEQNERPDADKEAPGKDETIGNP